MQVSDITRAVKDRDKAVTLNEVTDLARCLNFLSEAVATKPTMAPVEMPDSKSMLVSA